MTLVLINGVVIDTPLPFIPIRPKPPRQTKIDWDGLKQGMIDMKIRNTRLDTQAAEQLAQRQNVGN